MSTCRYSYRQCRSCGSGATVGRRFSGRFVEVTPDEIQRLEILDKGGLPVEPLEGRLPIGETVVVKEGPLKGLVGEIIDYRGASRIVVRVDSIRQVLSVQVPAESVQRPEKAA